MIRRLIPRATELGLTRAFDPTLRRPVTGLLPHPGRCRSEAVAALAGVSPRQASSGKTTRHRLNPFGDRQLNRALHVIVNWRMPKDPRTHAYLARRPAQKTDPELRRCLKRYAARQLSRLMEAQP